MISKETSMIVKILGIIGAIFLLIAQFTPWGVGLYLFGADLGFLGFNWFYVSFFESGVWQAILIAIIMIILFFVNLVVLLLSVQAIVRLNTHGLNIYQKLPIYVTVEFILYIVGFSIAAGGLTGYGIVSVGFVMILIAMIIFWIIFALAKSQGLITTPMFHQSAYHQPPAYQQHPPVQQPTYHPPPQQATPQQQPPPTTHSPPQQPQASATPKFCSQCGAPLSPNTKFCAQCGNKL
ncbi:MAG: zinc ribbon domain-containing protein [Thermoplasmatales archaeon]|nr:MAG: zinc ribbon domain-containing protein [Thermoplasmatales archaeon]